MRRDKSFFTAIKEIGEALNSNLEPRVFFKLALEKCIKFTHSDKGSMITVDEDSKTLEIKYQVGLGAGVEEALRLQVGEGVTGLAAKDKRVILVNDVSASSIYIEANPDVKSECAVPILYKNQLMGVISVDSKKRENYQKGDVEFLKMISGHFGQVLKSLEHTKALELKIYHDEILLEVNRILSSSLNIDDPLEELLYLLEKRGQFKRGALILYNEAKKQLEIRAHFGYTKSQAKRGVYQREEGVVGKVYRTGKPMALKNTARDALFMNKTKAREALDFQSSFFCLPLIAGAKTIGIMIFDKAFTGTKVFEQNFNFLKMLVTQISKQLQIHFLAEKEKIKLKKENEALRSIFKEPHSFGGMIGKSSGMKLLFQQIQAMATVDSTVLITGESGTGKELVAAAIHYNSPRASKPFITINCAAIPEHLLESELFGHKKGSFTGANQDKTGKFKLAHNGALFLDEIGEMPKAMQAKLLRVLQEGSIDPVGSTRPEKLNVRILAATNRNLLKEVKHKNFREDLYYRLSTLPIHLPTLRERKEDIPLLIEHFLAEYCRKYKKKKLAIDKKSLDALINYGWPGNIRELKSVIERSAVLCDGKLIKHVYFDQPLQVAKDHVKWQTALIPAGSEDFPSSLEASIIKGMTQRPGLSLKHYRDILDKAVIEQSLRKKKGVHLQVAKELGISRETLRKRIAELKVDIYTSA